jgi:DNA-binding response OmpR family regulator
MPDTDSKGVFMEMRRIRPDVPVLISSGYSETKVEELFLGVEISGFIQKPYLYPGLREKLRVISGGKNQGQSKNVDTPPLPSVG